MRRGLRLLCALCVLALAQGAVRYAAGASPRPTPNGAFALASARAEDAPATRDAERLVESLVPSSDGERRIEAPEAPAFVGQLLEVAIGELGYTEGRNNATKYGQWAGDLNAAWCAEFICWCVDQVDQRHGTALLNEVYPFYTGSNTGRDWFIQRGRFVNRKGNVPGWGYQWLRGADHLMRKNEFIPRPGDLIFFSYNEAGDTAHVALVEYCAWDMLDRVVIHVIEGNNLTSVQRNSYYLDNSQVLGFGVYDDAVGTTMRRGNSGEKVLWLQSALNQLGFLDERHITGTYGGNTYGAVVRYQQTLPGKRANGLADRETQQAIEAELAEIAFNAAETWMVTDE